MSGKSIVVILAAVVISAALVFDGVSHRRNTVTNQVSGQAASAQDGAAASAASGPGSASSQDPSAPNAENATQPDAAAGDAAQDPASVDAAQGQADGNPANGNPADGNLPAEDGSPSADAAQSQDNARQSAPAPPAIIVPAGTTLTVRLGEDLGSRISQVNQRFSATLDRDVIVHGQTVIAAGSSIYRPGRFRQTRGRSRRRG